MTRVKVKVLQHILVYFCKLAFMLFVTYRVGPRRMDPFAVGGDDLDPLSGLGIGGMGGGGMIMDPRRSGGPLFGPERSPPMFGPSRGGGMHPDVLPP